MENGWADAASAGGGADGRRMCGPRSLNNGCEGPPGALDDAHAITDARMPDGDKKNHIGEQSPVLDNECMQGQYRTDDNGEPRALNDAGVDGQSSHQEDRGIGANATREDGTKRVCEQVGPICDVNEDKRATSQYDVDSVHDHVYRDCFSDGSMDNSAGDNTPGAHHSSADEASVGDNVPIANKFASADKASVGDKVRAVKFLSADRASVGDNARAVKFANVDEAPVEDDIPTANRASTASNPAGAKIAGSFLNTVVKVRSSMANENTTPERPLAIMGSFFGKIEKTMRREVVNRFVGGLRTQAIMSARYRCFRRNSRAFVGQLLEASRAMMAMPGQRICTEGSHRNAMYLIALGTAHATKNGKHVKDIIGPHGYVSSMALCSKGVDRLQELDTHCVTLTAETFCDVRVVYHDTMIQLDVDGKERQLFDEVAAQDCARLLTKARTAAKRAKINLVTQQTMNAIFAADRGLQPRVVPPGRGGNPWTRWCAECGIPPAHMRPRPASPWSPLQPAPSVLEKTPAPPAPRANNPQHMPPWSPPSKYPRPLSATDGPPTGKRLVGLRPNPQNNHDEPARPSTAPLHTGVSPARVRHILSRGVRICAAPSPHGLVSQCIPSAHVLRERESAVMRQGRVSVQGTEGGGAGCGGWNGRCRAEKLQQLVLATWCYEAALETNAKAPFCQRGLNIRGKNALCSGLETEK